MLVKYYIEIFNRLSTAFTLFWTFKKNYLRSREVISIHHFIMPTFVIIYPPVLPLLVESIIISNESLVNMFTVLNIVCYFMNYFRCFIHLLYHLNACIVSTSILTLMASSYYKCLCLNVRVRGWLIIVWWTANMDECHRATPCLWSVFAGRYESD